MAENNEELLKNIWNQLTSDNQTTSDFETWKSNFSGSEEIQGNIYNYLKENNFTESDFKTWSTNVGLKKKENLEEEISSGVEEVTESVQTDGSSDSSDTNLLNNPVVQPQEIAQEVITQEVDTTSSIDGVKVDNKIFNEFSENIDTVDKQTEDPFSSSINVINQDLISGSEEQAVPLLKYHFEQYGFNFEEASIGDVVDVTSANGEKISIDLDNYFSSNDSEETLALKTFLEKNKAESRRIYNLENKYTALERKFSDDKDIGTSVNILNTKANVFNKQVQGWIQNKRKIDEQAATFSGLTQKELDQPGVREAYTNFQNAKAKNDSERDGIIARDNDLKTQGYVLDQTMGRYSEMQAKRGQTSGAMIDAIWTGVARKITGAFSYMVDAASFGETGGAGIGSFNKVVQDVALKMYGTKKDLEGAPPSRKAGEAYKLYQEEYKKQNPDSTDKERKAYAVEMIAKETEESEKNYESYLLNSGLSEEEIKNVKAKAKDVLAKQKKFDIYNLNDEGGYDLKKIAGGGRYSKEARARNISDLSKDSMIEILRTAPAETFGSSSTTKEYSDLMKEGFWGGAYLGLMESLPAMMGGPGAAGFAQRTAGMFLQVSDHVNEEMFKDPDFADISEKEKLTVTLPLGIVVGVLESVGLRNAIKSKGLLNKVLLKSLGKYKGLRQVEKRGFTDVVRQEVDNMIARGALTIGAGGVAEFETGVAQEIADIGIKSIYNSVKEADMFQTPESIEDGINQVLRAGAQEAVGGFIMGVPGGMVNAAASKDFTRLDDGVFEVFEDMVGDGTSTKLIDIQLKNKVNSGELTVKAAKEQQDVFNELKGVYNKIPSDYTTNQKKVALGLLLNKQELEQRIAGKDPSSVKSIQDKIDGINIALEKIGRDALAATENPNKGRVEDEEKIITEKDAVTSLKEQGIENPTKEQIKTEQDALQKQSTESVDAQESSTSSETMGQGVSNEQSTEQSETESKSEIEKKSEEEIDKEEASDFEALVDPDSKVESDIDNLPKKRQTVTAENGVEMELNVNEENPNLSFTENLDEEYKKYVGVPVKNELSNKVLKQAKNAAKAISKIFPSLKIVVHRNTADYLFMDRDNSRGMYQPKDNTIHINLSKANGRTVAHEIFHAVLLNKLKMNDKVARAVTKKMVQALSRSKTIDKATRTELKKFLKNYDSEIQNEEKLSEIVGMVADNYTSLTPSSKSVVRKWVEKIAAGLGIEIGQSEQDVIDLLNTIARKTVTGEQITEGDLKAIDDFAGGKKVKNPAKALARKQLVGGFEVSYTENENIEAYIKDGRVTEPKNVSEFNGLQTIITSPDDMLAGEIKYKGKTIFEGEGGVFFVTKFGDVWASGAEGTANTIANGLNTQLKQNKGRAFLTLTKGTDAKLVSSASGVNSTLAVLNTMLENNIISTDIFKSAVSQAILNEENILAEKKKNDIAKAKKEGKELIEPKTNSKKVVLSKSISELLGSSKKYFTDPKTTTFETRGNVVKGIVSEIAKSFTTKQSKKSLAEFLGGDTSRSVGVGNTKLKSGKPGSQALVDLIAKIAAEGLTKGLNVGDVYAVIEINSEVAVKEDSHPSYPFHISMKNGKKPILHLIQNRQNGRDVFKPQYGTDKKTKQKLNNPYKVGNVSVMTGQFETVSKTKTEVETKVEEELEVTAKVRKQKSDAEKLGILFKMNLKGFMPNTIPLGELQQKARRLGLRVERALYESGYQKGQVSGYYFSNGVTQNGKPRFYNPRAGVRKQKSMGEIGRSETEAINIIKLGRENNIKDNTIVDYLKRNTSLLMKDIKPLIKVSNFVLKNVPEVFGNIKGGMMAGIKVFNKVYEFRKNLLDNNLTATGKKIVKLNQEIDDKKSQIPQGDLFDAKKSEKIEAEIKKLEDQISKIQTKARTEKNKFYKLTQEEIDNATLDFLQSQPEYIAASNKGAYSTLQAQMTSQMMNAFEGGVMRGDAAARIKLARKLIQRKGKSDLQATQRDLRNFIRKSLPSFIFQKPEVVKLMQKITNANPKNIENLKEEVLEYVNKKTNTELTKKINEILGGKYQDTQSGRKKAYKVSNEVRLRLESIKKLLTDINSETDINVLDEVGQKLQNEMSAIQKLDSTDISKLTADYSDLQIALNFVNAQQSLDISIEKTEGLQFVIDNLTDLINDGKSELEADLRAKHLKYIDNFQKAYYEITGKKIEMYIPNPEFNDLQVESKSNPKLIKNPESKQALLDYTALSKAKKEGVINRAKIKFSELTEGMVAFVIGNNDLLNLMSKIGKMPGELFGGDLQEMVTFKIDESTNEFKARKMATTIIMNAKVEEVYGNKWRSKSQNDSMPLSTGIEMSSGVKIEDLSQNQMAYLVNQYKDPANQASFENKYGKDYQRVMKEIEALLNDEVKELMRWQVEEFFPSLYDGYNEVYKKVYRTSMPWNEHYAGRIYREGVEDNSADVLSNDKGAYKGFASPGSTKSRVNNTAPIQSMDQMAAMMTYVNDMNYFAAYAENLNDVANIFGNKNIKNAIVNNYGKGPLKSIQAMIDTLSKRGLTEGYGMEWINNVTSTFVIGRLAINPTIFIKQLTSAPAYAVRIGFRNWMKYGTMKLPQMKSNWKEITDNSVYIQDRYGESILRTLESYAPSKVQTLIPSETMGSIVDVLMYLVKQGDKGAIVIGGVPNYAFYKDQYRKKNPTATDQEVIDYAIKMFERDTKSSQQSSDLQDKDQFQTGNVFARGANMFLTSVKQYLRKEMTTTRNLYRKINSGGKEGKGTYWENFKTLAMYHSILPVIFQYIAAGLPGVLAPWEDEDEETLIRAAVLGNLNGLFLIGSLVDAFGDLLTSKPWTGKDQSQIPLLSIGLNFFRELNEANRFNVTRVDKNGKQRTQEAIEKSIAGKQAATKKAFYNLANSGLPLKQVERLIKNAELITSGKAKGTELIMRILQFSDYQVTSKEQRDAAKKKKKKPRTKKLTNKELQRYDPEAYQRKMEIQNRMRNSDLYIQKQEIKRQQRERRQQMLEERYN